MKITIPVIKPRNPLWRLPKNQRHVDRKSDYTRKVKHKGKSWE